MTLSFLVETKMEAYGGEGLVKDKIGFLLGFGTIQNDFEQKVYESIVRSALT